MSFRIFNEKTGEMLPPGLKIILIHSAKCKEKDWMMLYQSPKLLSLILDGEITGLDLKVLLFLVYLVEYENIVNVSQSYIGEILQIPHQSQISRSITKLEKKGYLEKQIVQGQKVLVLSKYIVRKGRKPNAKKNSNSKTKTTKKTG